MKVLTPEVEKLILDNAQLYSTRKIAKMSGMSRDTVRRVFRRNNIEVSEELRQKWRSDAARSKTTFTFEEDEILRKNYLTTPVKAIGKIINRSFCGITTRLNQLGLVIPPELKAERKKTGMFRKGSIPPMKGKKMNPEQYKKYKHTFFQKGHVPHNAKKDWEEIIRLDRSGRSYILIKLPEKRRLVYKHVWLWESEHGKVPDGHAVVFKDGNSLNCVSQNLECITKKELFSRSSMYNYPEELVRAIQLKSAIRRRINRIKKQENEFTGVKQ